MIYLNRTYANIYDLIGEKMLPSPNEKNYTVGNTNATSKIKIAFLGDSLTAGVGASSVENTYPYLIAKKINETKQIPVEVLNLGIPAATSLDVLKNQVSLSNNFNPDKVVIFIGINDMHNRLGKKELEKNLYQIIANLKLDKKNIYLVNIPYLGSKQSFVWPNQHYFLYQTQRYYDAIINVWKNTEVNSVDVFLSTSKSFLNDTSWYATDNFHPNDLGYEQLAKSIYTYMYHVNTPL